MSQASAHEIDEQISAYFDGELDESVRARVEAELGDDEELAARFADLQFMREMVVGDLEHQAERVHEARFEQIWDNFDAALERESRLQEAAEAPPSLWQRFSEWVRPMRIPIAAIGAAGVLALVFARSVGAPDDGGDSAELASNTQEERTSEDQAGEEKTDPAAHEGAKPSKERAPAPKIAVAPDPDQNPEDPEQDPEMFPQPTPGEAEIRHIEFGGRSGTISQVEGSRGTTTVIWVTDDDPVDSERSL